MATRSKLLPALLAIALLSTPSVALASDDSWDQSEVGLVWLLNDVRRNPGKYAAEWGIPELAAYGARPPLSYSRALAGATNTRSVEMSVHGYAAHRSPITGKWPNQIAREHGYALPEAYGNDQNNIESIHIGASELGPVLASLMRSPSHRAHLIGDGWFLSHTEIGIGYVADGNYWTIHTAYADPDATFITGVAFDDLNGNGSFDPGEGLPGVTVTSSDGPSTATNPGGGWTLPLTPGRHTITIAGGDFLGTNRTRIYADGGSIILDAESGTRIGTLTEFRTCGGRIPTIVGTNGDDVIVGTPGPDVIWAGAGNDTIRGGIGSDTICGGPGNDTISGNRGRDRINGNSGDDYITGGPQKDIINPGPGDDSVRATYPDRVV